MNIEFFDIENDQLVLNVNILTVPCLKAIKEHYKDPFPAFTFLYHRFKAKGPYSNEPEDEKDEILLREFPGEYTLEDPVMITAIEWFQTKITPTYRYYLDNKILMEKLGKYGRDRAISEGRDGNYSAMQNQLKNSGKTIVEFKQLEKVVEQELEDMNKSKNRGNNESSYDEN